MPVVFHGQDLILKKKLLSNLEGLFHNVFPHCGGVFTTAVKYTGIPVPRDLQA